MKKIINIFVLVFLFFTLIVPITSAQLLNSTSQTANDIQTQTNKAAGLAGLSQNSVGTIAAVIIQAFLSLLGIIFIVLIIIAGYKWMVAAGNEEQIKKSQATLKTAIIGLIIVLGAYAITYFVFNNLPFGGGSDMPNPN